MDPNSLNYNAAATVDDGSCAYVAKSQQAFILDISALWCGTCGTYGIPDLIMLSANSVKKWLP
jgi:hypothetical protein